MAQLSKICLWTLLFTCLMLSAAQAHFQLLFTPEMVLIQERKVDLTLVFTHPFEGGEVLEMGRDNNGLKHSPLSFSVRTPRGNENLLKQLQPFAFKALKNSGVAYRLSGYRFKGLGDYTFVLDPGPYFEESEGIYIQQLTKVILNKGGAATDWSQPMGLAVEILPLSQPYALWAGNVFRGQVVRVERGRQVPVPHAVIEVEALNHLVEGNGLKKEGRFQPLRGAFISQQLLTDSNGYFSYGVPAAGWWGFAALGAGGERTHQGRPLSLDAVFFIQAKSIQ